MSTYITPYINNLNNKIKRDEAELFDLDHIEFQCYCSGDNIHIIPKTNKDKAKIEKTLPFMKWNGMFNWFACDVSEDNGLNLYYTLLNMLFKCDKKYCNNNQGFLYYNPDQSSDIDSITYYPLLSGLTIHKRDGSSDDIIGGTVLDFIGTVDGLNNEMTGPHGSYIYDHIIQFDNYYTDED